MGRVEELEELKRRIAEAKRLGLKSLSLSGIDKLEFLPDEIAELTELTELRFGFSSVSDISALAGLTQLTKLDLSRTEVRDISALSGLTKLTELSLYRTKVRDISPVAGLVELRDLVLEYSSVRDVSALAGLTKLTRLHLARLKVTDLAALAGLTSLTELNLEFTYVDDVSALAGLTNLAELKLWYAPVSNISALVGLSHLTSLDLRGTQVGIAELRSLTGMEQLLRLQRPQDTSSGRFHLRFDDCRATMEDPRLKEISRIRDPSEQMRALLEYFEETVPQGVPEPYVGEEAWNRGNVRVQATDWPEVPGHAPAPLETEVLEQRLVRSMRNGPPLAPGAVDDRARKGWSVIAAHRDDLVAQVSLANYRPLAAAVGALSRALGPTYEAMNEIGVGIAGQRLAALVQDAVFMKTLPDGSGAEVADLANTLATFSNRFPEWLAYQEDATRGFPSQRRFRKSLPRSRLWRSLWKQAGMWIRRLRKNFAMSWNG
jgi:hypothetical protein